MLGDVLRERISHLGADPVPIAGVDPLRLSIVLRENLP